MTHQFKLFNITLVVFFAPFNLTSFSYKIFHADLKYVFRILSTYNIVHEGYDNFKILFPCYFSYSFYAKIKKKQLQVSTFKKCHPLINFYVQRKLF